MPIKQRRNGKAGKTKARKARTYAQLKKALDGVFSEIIRRRDLMCQTCGMWPGDWKRLQCGHFISRVHLSTRWDEQNCAAQCYACNVLRRGNPGEFALWLQKQYGPTIIAELVYRKNQSVKFTRSDLEWKIADYRARLQNLP